MLRRRLSSPAPGHSVSITSCISSLIAVKAPSSFDGMSNDRIEFIVRYLNGGEARIWIPRWNLQQGDHVAQLIAGEKQRAGEIPDGEIDFVTRAPT